MPLAEIQEAAPLGGFGVKPRRFLVQETVTCASSTFALTGSTCHPSAVRGCQLAGPNAAIMHRANKVMLQASLHYVLGESTAANRFQVDQNCRISINLNQMKVSGEPVSTVMVELRQWMEAYLAYCRQEIDPHAVDSLVAAAVRRNH